VYEPVCVLTMKEPVERRVLTTRPHGVALLRSVYVRKLRKMHLRNTDVLAHGSQYDVERFSNSPLFGRAHGSMSSASRANRISGSTSGRSASALAAVGTSLGLRSAVWQS
jgi:hypothetical protein